MPAEDPKKSGTVLRGVSTSDFEYILSAATAFAFTQIQAKAAELLKKDIQDRGGIMHLVFSIHVLWERYEAVQRVIALYEDEKKKENQCQDTL